MQQTTVQNSNTIRFGSGKLEVGPDVNSLVDAGAVRGVKFTESWDKLVVRSDNAGIVKTKIKNHQALVECEAMEILLSFMNMVRGGIDTYATVAAAEVVGFSQVVASGAWAYDDTILYTHQMGDGTKITATSVTGSTDGLLVANTDYSIIKEANGKWGVAIRDSATVTTLAQTITIVFTYTPAASCTLKSGGLTAIAAKVVRITNTNEAGKLFRITVYAATNEEGINIEFPEDEGDDPAMVPIKMMGQLDATRTAGDQLFEIYDEQYV